MLIQDSDTDSDTKLDMNSDKDSDKPVVLIQDSDISVVLIQDSDTNLDTNSDTDSDKSGVLIQDSDMDSDNDSDTDLDKTGCLLNGLFGRYIRQYDLSKGFGGIRVRVELGLTQGSSLKWMILRQRGRSEGLNWTVLRHRIGRSIGMKVHGPGAVLVQFMCSLCES